MCYTFFTRDDFYILDQLEMLFATEDIVNLALVSAGFKGDEMARAFLNSELRLREVASSKILSPSVFFKPLHIHCVHLQNHLIAHGHSSHQKEEEFHFLLFFIFDILGQTRLRSVH